MKKKVSVLMLALVVLVFWETPAFAFQCNDRIVSIGDAQADVMMKCGGPTLQDSREENIIERIDTDVMIKRTIIIDEWTYNLGPDSLTRTLRFENGELVDIQTGNYGY